MHIVTSVHRNKQVVRRWLRVRENEFGATFIARFPAKRSTVFGHMTPYGQLLAPNSFHMPFCE
jgi:hypothetical protein